MQAIKQAQETKKDGKDARIGLLFLSKRNTAAEDPAFIQVCCCAVCSRCHHPHLLHTLALVLHLNTAGWHTKLVGLDLHVSQALLPFPS